MTDGVRAQTVMRFWKASRAWYDRDGESAGWNFGTIIEELRSLTFILGSVAYHSQALLEMVIESQAVRPIRHEGKIHRLFPLQIVGREVTYAIIDEWSNLEGVA